MFVVFLACLVFFECYGDHRDLHVRTHSFPTRRASDLLGATGLANGRPRDLTAMGEGVTALAGKTSIDERRSLGRNSALTEVLVQRSEEHTSELQSLMRISYAVFCLKTNKRQQHQQTHLPYHTKAHIHLTSANNR